MAAERNKVRRWVWQMTRTLVLYYSSYGHTALMAGAVAKGLREGGANATVKRVPELVPEQIAIKAGYKTDLSTPIAAIDELAFYDAIVIGTPTRFGAMASQMKNFLDQAGGLWLEDRLVGKVGSAFTTTGSQHGGQEATILSMHTVLLHLGMIVVGLPYSFKGQSHLHEIAGGSPYGASALCRPGERQPSDNEIDGARFQGWHVSQIATALKLGREASSPEKGVVHRDR